MAAAAAAAGAGRWELVRRGRARRGAGGARRAAPPAEPPPRTRDRDRERARAGASRGARRGELVPGPSRARARSLADALAALDVAALQRELDKSQALFPDSPSLWAKDLAGVLNHQLQAPRSEPTLGHHAHDYPYGLVSKELRGVIRALLAKASGALELFLDHCIYTMLQELDKTPGESLHGYRICIQAVLLDRPRIATANLGKYLELLRSHQNRPAKCLTIMWALGQAGFADLTEGLKVWLGIMLPVLGMKALSPYAIAYLDRLLMTHPNLTKGFGLIGPKDFFPLLDFAFMPNNSLVPSLQEQLRQLYPRLKVLAFGTTPETTLHAYFPSFLSRATPNCPPDMKRELLRCLHECLSTDPLSFSVWRQLYTKHLSQSSLLLNHLLESWDSSPRKVRQALQDTVCSFKVTNEELALKGAGNAQDVAACDIACKSLLRRLKGRGFPWARLLLVALVFLGGFLMHDIRIHGSFHASSSAHVLRSSGVLAAAQLAWHEVSHYSLEGYSWLEQTVLAYYTRAMTALEPNLRLVWAKTNETATYLSGKCSSHLAWAWDRLPWLAEWLHAQVPEAVAHVAESLKELLVWLVQSCLLPALEHAGSAVQRGWQRWVDSCNGEASWGCLRDHLAGATYSSWLYLQSTTAALRDWALAALSGR
ncbi:transmembrane protein 214 isoform X3 [Alligator mississippiensis]|uniref:transmembrane protein 214 isoform X3 n=1 Tax=Alligator mississippiensis TaxID=8496 RepID=UPI0028777B88|nr:transmembrane protein 214 isoform X3 [Alligator mississippiensis]